MTQQQAEILSDFQQYLDDFNGENIKGIRAHLDDNLQVLVNGKVIGSGADTLLPMWQADMNKHRRVKVTKGPTYALKEDEKGQKVAEIDVELTATIPFAGEPDEVQVVPVIYVYDTTTMKQIRHVIF